MKKKEVYKLYITEEKNEFTKIGDRDVSIKGLEVGRFFAEGNIEACYWSNLLLYLGCSGLGNIDHKRHTLEIKDGYATIYEVCKKRRLG